MRRLLPLSAALLFLFGAGCSFLPPATPDAPEGPNSGRVGIHYLFTAVTEDPYNDPVAYRWRWGDGSISEWSDYSPSGEPVQAMNAWREPGRYRVMVQARDILGMMSGWSEALAVSIEAGGGGPYPDTVVATIPIGADPVHIDAHPGGGMVYVGNEVVDEVTVISTRSNAVVARIQTGHQQPWDIACHPGGERVYAVNHGWGLTVINARDQTVEASIPINNDANAVAVRPQGDFVYVANDEPSNSVTVINARSHAIVATVPVGSDPRDVAVSPSGERVYVACTGSNEVSVIDAGTNRVVATVAAGAHRVIVSPEGDFVYATSYNGSQTTVIRTRDNTVVATINAGGVGGICLPGYLFVANADGNRVNVFDRATNTLAGHVPVGSGPWAVTALPDGSRLYTPDRWSKTVTVIGCR